MSKYNLFEDVLEAIQKAEDSELSIEAIVFTSMLEKPWFDGEADPREKLLPEQLNKPLNWEAARTILDYSYDTGYGSQDCHNFYLYTKKHIFYIHEYDGSTSVVWINRNPPQA